MLECVSCVIVDPFQRILLLAFPTKVHDVQFSILPYNLETFGIWFCFCTSFILIFNFFNNLSLTSLLPCYHRHLCIKRFCDCYEFQGCSFPHKCIFQVEASFQFGSLLFNPHLHSSFLCKHSTMDIVGF